MHRPYDLTNSNSRLLALRMGSHMRPMLSHPRSADGRNSDDSSRCMSSCHSMERCNSPHKQLLREAGLRLVPSIEHLASGAAMRHFCGGSFSKHHFHLGSRASSSVTFPPVLGCRSVGWAVPPACTDGHNFVDVAIVILGAAADSVGHAHCLLAFVLFRLPLEIFDLLLEEDELWFSRDSSSLTLVNSGPLIKKPSRP